MLVTSEVDVTLVKVITVHIGKIMRFERLVKVSSGLQPVNIYDILEKVQKCYMCALMVSLLEG